MIPMRTFLALVVATVALGAFAQSDATVPGSAEFGRASGGAIDTIAKKPRALSGSLSLTHSTGAFRGRGYEGSLGGELLDDRLWFFAAASVLPRVQFSANDTAALDAKATAQPLDSTVITGAFSRMRQPVLATPAQPADGSLPSSFLSLRSTSVLSDRMMLNFSFTRSESTQSVFPPGAE